MVATVYVETTIPSFYYEVRTEPEMLARRIWTRRWWDDRSVEYNLVTSKGVTDELNDGDYPNKAKVLALVATLKILPFEEGITEIVDAYIKHRLMPKNPLGDALHLALASYHKCDFLLTWNCNHLANANKFDHIRRVNGLLGLFVPTLVTPLELLGVAES